ncbi:helicase [Leuconostoc citreum]|uniref:VapE domain-containing protein n=1 Tax=Leuconostoc citreum TaxID=33964 RepID=UPI0021A29391|nr:VapE domain-containing protein [Leuconostoc citreum]MCT3075319.1 helicase [Leuconostoc citreum]
MAEISPELIEQVKAIMQAEDANKEVSDPMGLIRYKDGRIKTSSLINIERIIDNDKLLTGKFKFNLFSAEIEVVQNFKIDGALIRQGSFNDAVIDSMMSYIENKYGALFGAANIISAISNIARRNEYNPIVEYLDAAQDAWDGKHRFADLFPKYLGVQKSEATTLITTLFMVGAAAKAFEKRFKFDFVLDLVGGQGAGKTTMLRKLAVDWYTDQFVDFKDKDSYAVMLRSWIVNDDEMVATNKARFDELKKFVSAETLEFRRPYGRGTEQFSKNFVIARTTNELTYLKDKTGERRFLPLLVNKKRQKKHPVTDLHDKEVQQLWGEAMTYYVDYLYGNFTFELTQAQEEMLEEYRKSFMYIDELEVRIDEYIDNLEYDRFTTKQLSFALFGDEDATLRDRRLGARIKNILDNLKDWQYTTVRTKGKQSRGYKRYTK